jgi:hypothetical protein
MTKKEIEEIKSLLVGLAGISNFQSTGKRVDKMLAVLEKELSKLHQPTVMHCVCENGNFGDIEVLEIDDRCVPSCKKCLKPLRKHGA